MQIAIAKDYSQPKPKEESVNSAEHSVERMTTRLQKRKRLNIESDSCAGSEKQSNQTSIKEATCIKYRTPQRFVETANDLTKRQIKQLSKKA